MKPDYHRSIHIHLPESFTAGEVTAVLRELEKARGALVTVAQWDTWASEWLAKNPVLTTPEKENAS